MLLELVSFLHPVWQCIGIALGFLALRDGLALRQRRCTGQHDATRSARRSRHVRFGKSCLWVISSGYLLGIAELSLVRGKPILRSAHFYFATLSCGLLAWGAIYGFAMLRSPKAYAARRDLHGFLLPLALFMMVGVGLLGLTLLP